MKQLTLILAILGGFLLSGCSSYSVIRSCAEVGKCANYAMVSESSVSGLYATVGGKGNTCKVSTFGDIKEWRVTYAGNECAAVLNGGVTEGTNNE